MRSLKLNNSQALKAEVPSPNYFGEALDNFDLDQPNQDLTPHPNDSQRQNPSSFHRSIADLNQIFNALESKLASFSKRVFPLANLEDQTISNRGLLPQTTSFHQEFEALKAQMTEVTRLFSASFAGLNQENEALKAHLAEASSTSSNYSQEIEALKAQLAEERRFIETVIAEKDSERSSYESQIKKLTEELESLKNKQAAPRLNSQNSSLSPSFDIFGRRNSDNQTEGCQSIEGEEKPEIPEKRKKGAQKGHKAHFRPLPDDAERVIYGREGDELFCPSCGEGLERAPEKDKNLESAELVPVLVRTILTTILAYKCPKCGKYHYGDAPKEVFEAGLTGFSLMSMIVLFKVVANATMRKIQTILQAAFGHSLSLGTINKRLKFVSDSLLPIFLELLDNVKTNPVVNIDETCHKNKGKRHSVWVFCAEKDGQKSVVFKIGTRSKFMLEMVLGPTFTGIIGSDFYSAYRSFVKSYPNILAQYCLAHLIRDFKYCYDFNHEEVKKYGEKVLVLLTELFNTFREYKTVKHLPEGQLLHAKLHKIKARIIEAVLDAPTKFDKPRTLAERFKNHAESYFTFLDHDVEPTNNCSERALRSIVIDRKICYGTQSRDGMAFCEVMWSIYSTLKERKMDVMKFLLQALKAFRNGTPLPSLVNVGSSVDLKYIELAKLELEERRKLKKADAAAEAAAESTKEAAAEAAKEAAAEAAKEAAAEAAKEAAAEAAKEAAAAKNQPAETEKTENSENSETKTTGPKRPPDPSREKPSKASSNAQKNEENSPLKPHSGAPDFGKGSAEAGQKPSKTAENSTPFPKPAPPEDRRPTVQLEVQLAPERRSKRNPTSNLESRTLTLSLKPSPNLAATSMSNGQPPSLKFLLREP